MTYKPTLIQELTRYLYSVLLFVLLPIIVWLLNKKTQTVEGAHKGKWHERFGFVQHNQTQGGVLFHCVSVGEVVTASALIKTLLKEKPSLPISITTTTPTGSARVKSIFGAQVNHFYLPFDLPFAMNAMLRRVKPELVIITEVELWPNMIHACWKKAIPAMVLNARMTTRSAQRYKKLSALFAPVLFKLAHICAQGKRDYENYVWLGLPMQKLTLTNNLKFDQAGLIDTPITNPFSAFNKKGFLTVVGGSTHEGEEAALIATYKSLLQSNNPIQLVIVPRHPQRFDSVAEQLIQEGIDFDRTSALDSLNSPHHVLLVDEMGKLGLAYHAANIGFVGGSLTDRGGHNALEPAGASIPVIMGPHTYNNPAICEVLVEAGALTIVENKKQLAEVISTLANDESRLQKQGKAGIQVLKQNQGALLQSLNVVQKFI